MSNLSHKTRKKLRKLNCGRGTLHSKRTRKGIGKQQIKQAVSLQSVSTQNNHDCISSQLEGSSLTLSFENLPVECKIKVFSFLDDRDKCNAANVCSEWATVMRTPQLWQEANFCRALSLGVGQLPQDKIEAYRRIKDRAKHFVYHLVSRGALLRRLRFELDIMEGEEIWLKFLIYCLKMTNSHELKVIHAKWTDSPDFMPFRAEKQNWKADRVKSFQNLLVTLADTSPALQELYTPFDWSMSSVRLLTKFKQLHTLELDRYWVFAVFREEYLNELLDNLPRLKRFKLSVCVPLLRTISFPQYIMSSDSLEVLDISNCTCFFLRSVRLPSLTSFATARNRWTGPMLSRDAIKVPCLHSILKRGASNLRFFNQCQVNEDWRSKVNAELEEALKSSCYCSSHKRGYLLY